MTADTRIHVPSLSRYGTLVTSAAPIRRSDQKRHFWLLLCCTGLLCETARAHDMTIDAMLA